MSEIESESRFLWKQVKFILMLPFTLLMVLFGKKPASELTRPFGEFRKFIFEPKVTITLIGLNIAVFIAQIFLIPQDTFISLVFQPRHLFTLKVFPMIASWFFHGSVAHLLGNMLFLYIFGRIIEQHFGSGRMLLIYLGSAVVSDVISAFAGQGGIGASGAIAGLISASILVKPFYLTYLAAGIPLPIVLVGWLAIFADVSGILYPVQGDNVGHFAHLGGYLAVALLVFLMNRDEREHMKKGLLINVLFVVLYVFLSIYL